MSISCAATDGHTPTTERERLIAMTPSLVWAFTLGVDHADKLQAAFWDGVRTAGHEPALLLSETGTVIRTTPDAEALLARNDALDIVGGRLSSHDATAADRLAAVVAKAIRHPGGIAGAVRPSRRAGGPPLVVTIFPLPRTHRVLAPCEAAALVTIVDPLDRDRADHDIAAAAFALTGREAQLAALLLAGHSVESASAVAAVSIATTRLRLRHLFAKTGTVRQSI